MKKIFQNILVLSLIGLILSCQGTNKQSKDGMLQHTVYFYLEEDISEADKKSFEEGLQKLMAIDAVYQWEIGKTGATPSRAVTDHEFDYSIFARFKTMEDYKVYADHPEHIEFINKYELFWKDVKVFDSEIIRVDE